MAKGRSRRGRGFEALFHVGIAGAFQQQLRGANPRQILLGHTDAAVGGDFVEHLCRGLRIAGGDFRRQTQPRQHAVSERRFRRQIGKRRFGLGVLVRVRKLRGLVEGSPRLGRLLGFQVLVATPAAHRGDDQDRAGDDENGILFPQLLELIATDILVDFIK